MPFNFKLITKELKRQVEIYYSLGILFNKLSFVTLKTDQNLKVVFSCNIKN
jgi:hypothetical protein